MRLHYYTGYAHHWLEVDWKYSLSVHGLTAGICQSTILPAECILEGGLSVILPPLPPLPKGCSPDIQFQLCGSPSQPGLCDHTSHHETMSAQDQALSVSLQTMWQISPLFQNQAKYFVGSSAILVTKFPSEIFLSFAKIKYFEATHLPLDISSFITQRKVGPSPHLIPMSFYNSSVLTLE